MKPCRGPPVAVLGGSWAVLGLSWAVLGRLWGSLGPSWGGFRGLLGRLGASGSRKGEKAKNIEQHNGKSTILASRGPLGRLLGGLLEAVLRPLGASCGPFWGRLFRPLGTSWGHLGRLLAVSGVLLGRRAPKVSSNYPWAAVLGASWAVLGPSWGFPGPSWSDL